MGENLCFAAPLSRNGAPWALKGLSLATTGSEFIRRDTDKGRYTPYSAHCMPKVGQLLPNLMIEQRPGLAVIPPKT